MKFRASFVFVLVAAVSACTSTSDSPLAPEVGASYAREGVKPPPPLGSEDTQIEISVSPSDGECSFDCCTECSLDVSATATTFFALATGRYFANTQANSGWVAFESNEDITASQNARIQFDKKTGQRSGQGTLTLNFAPFTVLDLSLVHDVVGSFGPCPGTPGSTTPCANLTFLYGDDSEGTLTVRRSDAFFPTVSLF
jgi:hypothetical protein